MERPSMETIWMNLALNLASRSTCSRKQVGTVITTPDLESVLSVGYNGNARGLPNHCDSDEPGHCGCIHSEINALIKCGYRGPKTMFVTMTPCTACAKAIINAQVTIVHFHQLYRKLNGLSVLIDGGVKVYWEHDLDSDSFTIGPIEKFGHDFVGFCNGVRIYFNEKGINHPPQRRQKT